ncbi:superoxide dismutase [Sphingomonas changbaiensis NBRC 104936]|uniref:Superoxide dismutase n=1 Tax=Sphingomonas changbaiensis NBRC 104936 TaxID=1219043 RepID=A0A0E9MKH0_9SPHN|nr:superoxide dismutase [Sphingomonas changbaiensis]GAO38003.1 superoxide dismutase [Sphingomonas changbaiensis NBRC 104936]
MAFELPPLPYDKSAFGDIISAETFDFHWGKHHRAYVNKTNELAPQVGLDGRRLSDVIRAAKESGNKGLFNNSAQLWNHSFYWQCLSPEAQQPTGALKQKIDEAFGSTDALLEKLKTESVNHFASGWGWLVLDGDQLKVTSLHDGDSPVAYDGMKPLLTIDVWEHAYYIDYRNARADYVDALLKRAINWDFVAQNLDGRGVSRADQEPAMAGEPA